VEVEAFRNHRSIGLPIPKCDSAFNSSKIYDAACLSETKRLMFRQSDLLLYDLIHPLFLNSTGEIGTENRVLTLIKNNPSASDTELMEKSDLSRATFYKYKMILQRRGLI
jgi:hypothetical protein